MKTAIDAFLRILRWFNPIVWLLDLRQSLTAASVILVLIGIVSMNIIWNYPWLGTLSACVAMLLVGRILNYFSLPQLQAIANVPRHVPVDEPLGIPIRLVNVGRWPGMELTIERSSQSRFLAPAAETSVLQLVKFSRRGNRALPAVLVETYFPFHLFRSRRWIDPATTITATPRRLLSEVDRHWQNLEAMLKGIASRAAQGDQIHYVGNREYREGVPVRRWDFASWARLGKPVLREFSSPSAKTVLIVVDNLGSGEPAKNDSSVASNESDSVLRRLKRRVMWWQPFPGAVDEPFERLLSLAASSVETLCRNGAAVSLQFAYGDQDGFRKRKYSCEAGADPGDLLIALGNATLYPPASLDDPDALFGEEDRGNAQNEAVIVLSCRDRKQIDRLRQSSCFPSNASSNALWVTENEVLAGIGSPSVGDPVNGHSSASDPALSGKPPLSGNPDSSAKPELSRKVGA